MIHATTFPWGIRIPKHRDLDVRPRSRADANRVAGALRMLADHLERVGRALPDEGPDDTHALPHLRGPVIHGVAQPTGVSMLGRAHRPL